MKKRMAFVLMALTAVAFSNAYGGEGAIKLGGGVIFEGKMPGGGVAAEVNASKKPAAVNFFFEYYNRSGETIVPVGIRLLFKKPVANKRVEVYFGAGGGIGYSRIKADTLEASVTKGLASGVFGFNLRAASKAGVFVEGAFHRFLVSAATTDMVGRAGIYFNVSGK